MSVKINGRLKVKTIKQEFKNEFGLSLRLYDGNSFADEDATLASIRKGDNKVGEISEDEGHHPDISFGWGYAEIKITTHAIEGLSENDFILAAKIDQLTNA